MYICKYGKIIIDKATITIKGLDYQAEYTGSDISCLYDNYDSISMGVNAEIEYTAKLILSRIVTSNFTDWTDAPTTDNMNTEYMCSTVGKED